MCIAAPRNPRIRETDYQLIRAYAQAGVTARAIAKELGYGDGQVQYYLRNLSIPLDYAPQVAINRRQFLLIQLFNASGLTIRQVASSLDARVGLVAMELHGRRVMRLSRIRALEKLFATAAPSK